MNEHSKKNYPFFDTIFQNSPIQMIKILLPFLPSGSQKTMAIFLKFFELKYTIEFFNRGNKLRSLADSIDTSNPMEMMSAMKELFPIDQQDHFDQILQMFQAMEMMQAFQDDSSFDNPFQGGNPQDMFNMFSGMFGSGSDNECKEPSSNEHSQADYNFDNHSEDNHSQDVCSQSVCSQDICSQDIFLQDADIPITQAKSISTTGHPIYFEQ